MPTVAELVSRGVPELLVHHLPRPEADVRWTATSELADPTPYLEGGEILLTTGLDTAAWRAEWEEYVARLAAAPVAALGLGTGLTHAEMPTALLAACRRHDVNLLEVPRAVTFVAVSRATARLLEEAERQEAREALDVQRSLVSAAARAAPDALLAALADALDAVACTVTREGRLDAGPFGDRVDRLRLGVVAKEVARLRGRGRHTSATVSDRSVSLEVQPLGPPERAERYLAVAVDGRTRAVHRTAVTTAVALLSLAIERGRERRETERALRARALELLLADDPRSARIVLEGDVDQPPLPQRCRVLRAAGSAEALGDGLLRAEAGGMLAALVARDGRARRDQSSPPPDAGHELVALAADRRTSALADALAPDGLLVGLGSLTELDETSRSHDTAGHALADASAAGPVVRWDTMVDRGALAALEPEKARAFAFSFLEPLLSPDLARHELTTTLRSFLRFHGSRAKVADDLGVHRNTVRARVTLIERQLGASLDDPQTRVSCWLALQLHHA